MRSPDFLPSGIMTGLAAVLFLHGEFTWAGLFAALGFIFAVLAFYVHGD